MEYLITDINGNKIKEGDKFEFSYLKELDLKVKLTGIIVFNDEDLAYEIDVIEDDEYVCLTYATNHVYISNIKKINS